MRRPPQETAESHRKISRRALILGGAQVVFAGGLAARMHQLQVQEADQFRLLAEENRIDLRLLAPARGEVFDREGRLLAGNEENFRVTMVRAEAGEPEPILQRLAELIPLDETRIERALREMRRRPYVQVMVAERLTWDQLSAVAVNAPVLPGVAPEVGLSRYYPLGQDFAHTMGYVGRVTDRDLANEEDQDPLLELPDFKIGKFGAESRLEPILRGRAGVRRIEVNAVGRVMRELGREEGRPGARVQLTLDAALQNYIQARLGEESAAAVVIDLRNGDLKAAVSAPSYDPNAFVQGITQADFDLLRNNDHRPLHNKIVQGLYPPGSTFKMITALAALEEEGKLDPGERIRCTGHLEVADRKFHCWSRSGHGNVNLEKSLVESCDVYYYDICQRVGIEKIAAMARRLGLGTSHPVAMTSVSEGLVPDRDWKRRRRGQDWVIGDTLNASIGQGFVLTSPLQLGVMTARIALGREVTPRMVKSIDGVEQPSGIGPSLGLKPENLAAIRKAMYGVNNAGRGTARASRIETAEHKWAGKTGTSQVRNFDRERASGRIRRNEDLPWNLRDHALYVGYAPFDDPQYAVAVVVEHGGGGSATAAPIARDIMLQAIHGGLPPLSAYPSNQRRAIGQRQQELPLREVDPKPSGRTRA